MITTLSRRQGLAALCLGVVPLAVQAQGTSTATSDEVVAETLNPLTVTATRAPRTADETLASVTVLDEADLRRQDPKDITDILRAQPGVDVSSNGGFGKTSSVYLRGTSSKSTVMMIDGIRLRSATAGSPAWQFLEPRMFERVEVVRGPRGSLYGADAVGGVVQLFTPEGQGEPTPSITAGGGTNNTQRYSASLSGAEGGTRYVFSASQLSTDGYEIVEGEGDKGYDNTTGFVRVSQRLDNGGEVGLLGLRARGNTEFVGGNTDYVQQVAGVYGELPVSERWTSRVTLSEARDESDNVDDSGDSVIDTRTRTARWENTLALGLHELVAGAEYSEDKVNASTDFSETNRKNVAVFSQALLDFSPVTVQASLRHDDNEAFGEELTGSLALGYALDRVHTLRTSYSTAFRAPTFNDLYWPFQDFGSFGTYEGNPDLEAETSTSTEIGVRAQYQRFFWDLAAYQTNIDDMISSTTVNGNTTPSNVDRARIRGVELGAGVELVSWDLGVALSYMDPENRETGNQLKRRSTQSLRMDADRVLGDWTLGGSVIAQNHRYDDENNDDRLPGYATLNLRAGWQLAPLWTARLILEDVFDRQYSTALTSGDEPYLSAGRAAFLSVNFGE